MALFLIGDDHLGTVIRTVPETVSSDIATASIHQSAAPATIPAEELDPAIQALPQELQDIIAECVLEISIPRIVTIDATYRPPSVLQLNRKSRQKFAEMYYGTAIFDNKITSSDAKLRIFRM